MFFWEKQVESDAEVTVRRPENVPRVYATLEIVMPAAKSTGIDRERQV